MKVIRIFCLLLISTLFLQNASAALLPNSSHYQGRSNFNENGLKGFVDFAVYDTLGESGDEWTGAGFTAPGANQFIYAYQIFCDTENVDPIEFFNIMGINDPPEPQHLTGVDTMTSQNPWENYPLIEEGVEPTGTEVDPNETRATWKFADGILFAGEYSWFLVFSSANDWVEGKYTFEAPVNPFSVPGKIASNPEPCTLILLGLGSTILLAKRKNLVQSHRV